MHVVPRPLGSLCSPLAILLIFGCGTSVELARDDGGLTASTDATPGPADATPGPPDATPGSADATPGSADATPGSPDATPPGPPDAAPLVDLAVCATGGAPFTTVSAAVAAAPSGATILVCAGTYAEQLTISRPLRLIGVEGAGSTILDAGGTGTALTLRQTGGAGLTIQGLTIRNGATPAEGGGIRCEASTLRLVDIVFASNVAAGGGGLYASDCVLDIDGARFEHNEGGETGGGAMLVESSGELRNSTFVSNRAVDGGGLYDREGSVRIAGNLFQENLAHLHGGGIYHDSDAAISGNSVLANQSLWTGGGAHIVAHAPTIDGNTIDGNDAANDGGGLYLHQSAAAILDNAVTGNGAADDGGGLRIFESALRLERNRIERNHAGDAGGGLKISHVPCELLDNVVRNNVSGNTGGGMDLDNDASHVRGGEVSGNTAASSGGGIFVWLGPWNGHTLEDIEIADNTAWRGAGLFVDDNFKPVTMRGLRILRNIAGKGGGLHVRATDFTITGSLFEGNIAYERGGGLLAGVNSAWWEPCTHATPCPPPNPIGQVAFVVFRGNKAPEGSAVWTDSAGLSVQSSILFENDRTSVTVAAPVATPGVISPPGWRYNDTRPATFAGMDDPTGTSGNITADPQFMNPAGGDFHLAAGSLCENSGDPAFVDGDGSRADMGMYGGSRE